MRTNINELIDAVYNGEKYNPGEDKRAVIRRGRANIFDINVCQEPGCKCGWNIKIGSWDYSLLEEILRLIDGKIR